MSYNRPLIWLAVLFAPMLLLSQPTLADKEKSETSHGSKKTAMSATPTSLTLAKNTTATIVLSNVSGTPQAESSNTSVASVRLSSDKISVTANAGGSARISIRDRSTNLSIPVTVTVPATPTMSASPSTLSLISGATSIVTLTNVSGSLSASSSNNQVASVSISGTQLR